MQIAQAEADKPVSIKCSRDFVATVVQAVKKEKSIANVTRRQLDMARYGKLSFSVKKLDENFTKITFTLAYNGDQL